MLQKLIAAKYFSPFSENQAALPYFIYGAASNM
jgi:hypothetical protein